MRKSQKRSATQANRSAGGRSQAKRSPDRRGAQDQARGTAPAQSRRPFRLAQSELGERIRAFDWASTDTGPISDWSNGLRTAVTICADMASAQQAEFAVTLEVHARRAAELSEQNEALRREVAEHKAAAEAMQLQLEVLNNMPAVAWTITPDGRCDFINRYYLETTGMTTDHCLAPTEQWKKAPDDLPPFFSGLHPDHRERAAKIFWGGIRSGTGWSFEVPFMHADGSYYWHFEQAVPLRDSQGKIFRFMGTCACIEDLKVAQGVVQDREKRLQEAREELARVTRLTAMGQLSASIAHEINQPLMAIVTNSDTCQHWLASTNPDLGKARAAAQRMARDARFASDIIARIHSLMNKTVSERALVDINALIRDVLDLTQGELRKHEVVADAELTALMPMILGDRVQLQQVILNLILNSIEAMIVVQDRPRALRVKSELNGADEIQVSLHDAGTGLDPSSADRIFDAFFTTKPSGIGMGLSICRSIVEAHGGRICALPGVPYGAIFQFSLPTRQ